MAKAITKTQAPKTATLLMKGAVAHKVYVLVPTDRNSEGKFWIRRDLCSKVQEVKGGVMLTAPEWVFTSRGYTIPKATPRKKKEVVATTPTE